MYIVATISKNSYAPNKIQEIIEAGATVLRFNFSHGKPDEMVERIYVAQDVIKKLKLKGIIKILADLPGDKLRLGKYQPIDYPVKAGTAVLFKSAASSDNPSDFIPVNTERIGTLVSVGQEVNAGDADICFKVTEVLDDNSFRARVLHDGAIPAMKGFNTGRGVDRLDHLNMTTLSHMERLAEINPDWVAFSFVNSVQFLERAKRLLREKTGWKKLPPLVAKIETPEAIKRIDEIASACDILMVARGDLAVTAPYELLGINQKIIVTAAKRAGKQVIVSTQILESLLDHHIPTRSEILDLTNIVLDGADGIMFAKETGLSMTPGYSVEVAKKIIEAVERNKKVLP